MLMVSPSSGNTFPGSSPSTPAGLLAALSAAELVTGRASFYVRLVTPLAKVIQRARGNGRIQPAVDASAAAR